MMLYRLLERIDRTTFSPEVVALLDLGGPIKNRIESLGISVFIVGMKSKLDLFSIIRLSRYLKENKPDILHTQLFAADVIGRLLGGLHGIPVIITSIRNIYYGGKLRDLLIKWTDRFAVKTTVVSLYAAKRLQDANIVPGDKLLTIHNGLDPSDFKLNLEDHEINIIRAKLSIPEHHLFILAVGSLTRQKGYQYLFDALNLLKSEEINFHLVIAGEGRMQNELAKLADNLGIETHISFIGHSDEVNKLMAAADMLVLSSLWEGLPGVVMEAMASSLPVVATSVGGTPELITEGKSGYLVPPGNPEKLADALIKMINLSDEERKKMGQAGRKRVDKYFHINKMVKAYEDLYASCMNNK